MKDLNNIVDIIEGIKINDHAIIIVMFDRLDYIDKHLSKLSPIYDIILVLGYKVDLEKVKKILKNYPHNVILIKRKYDDGPAGGFYIGYKYAIDNNYEFITFAEDDCYPQDMDLPFKIREKGYLKIPLTQPGYLDYQMWRYATLSKDVKVNMCPALYFFYEDAYALQTVNPNQIIKIDNFKVIHEHYKKYHRKSPFSINNYLSNRNLIIKMSKSSNIFKHFLYISSMYFDILFMIFHDRKSILPSILGIIDGITRNTGRFYKDSNLKTFQSINQHKPIDKPTDVFDIREMDKGGILSRLSAIIKLLFNKKNVLISSNGFGLQTSIYRLLTPKIICIIPEDNAYYEISYSNINRLFVLFSIPIILFLSLITLGMTILSNIFYLTCDPYKYME